MGILPMRRTGVSPVHSCCSSRALRHGRDGRGTHGRDAHATPDSAPADFWGRRP